MASIHKISFYLIKVNKLHQDSNYCCCLAAACIHYVCVYYCYLSVISLELYSDTGLWHSLLLELATPITNKWSATTRTTEPLIQVSRILSCGWGFKESNCGLSGYQDLEFLHDPSEKASILARAHLMHVPLRMVGLFPCLDEVFSPHMALVLKHLSGDYPLFSYFTGNNELWG